MYSLFYPPRFFAPAVACALALASTSPAATLQSPDGSVDITGEILSFDGDSYTIKSQFGELIIRREFVECIGLDCPKLEDETVDASNEPIELVSPDGSVRLQGELIDVTETDYVINTENGVLNVRKEMVSCEGAACPSTTVKSADFTVSVPDADAKELLAVIISDFAISKDFSLTESIGNGDTLASLLVGDETGQKVAQIEVEKRSETDALKSLLDGNSVFALTREKVTPEQLSLVMNRRVEDVAEHLNERIVGLDAVTFMVNANNQMDVMGMEDIRGILTGQVTNWAQLGGGDREISVHMLKDDSGIEGRILDEVTSGSEIRANLVLHDRVEALNAAVREDGNALGIAYRSQAMGLKVLSLASSCDVFFDNSDFAIQTEEYPLAVRLYQYTAKNRNLPEVARNVGDYIATDYGQQAISSQGLVPQKLRIMPMKDQGARLLSSVLATENNTASNAVMRDYIRNVSNARRISTSLHFLSGATALDSKAVGDIDRISDILRSQEYDGYELLVIGFSDSYGQLNSNLAISRRRAESVAKLLLEENAGYLDQASIKSYGIGPIAPVNCNDTDEGRYQNRRVEIWLRPKA